MSLAKFNVFEFSAAILEKGLFAMVCYGIKWHSKGTGLSLTHGNKEQQEIQMTDEIRLFYRHGINNSYAHTMFNEALTY